MRALARPTAIAFAGFCSFLNLYAPQSLLPLLTRQYAAGAVEVSHLISATTLAVALIAPFTGAAADMLGRKRIITAAMFALLIPSVMLAFANGLDEMVFWRFVQGLLLPPVFAVTVAYIGDELAPAEATSMAGIYMSASCFGGFFGRFLTGVLAEPFGLRGAFLGLTFFTLVSAVAVLVLLPKEKNFVPSHGLSSSFGHMLRHLTNPVLLATFAVGFAVLFNFVALFTYISFYLAAPPFNLSTASLGTIFVVYLAGVIFTPLTGRWIRILGRRHLTLIALGGWLVGLALTLSGSLTVIIAGLTLAAGCGFICQTAATSYVAISAQFARSSAVGLYVTTYYIGGSAGAILPGYAWNLAGWPGALAVIAAMLGVIAAMVEIFWRQKPQAAST
jgi:predicted MFS family arabinose efflux permease